MGTEYMSVAEAARTSGFTQQTIRKWIDQGKIPGAVKPERAWRIPIDWMQRMHERRERCLRS